MPDLKALLSRLEALEGADREVDAMIAREIAAWCFHDNAVESGCQSDTGFDCPDCGADSWGNVGPTGQKWGARVPVYTSSIDAIVALIEAKLPGCGRSVDATLPHAGIDVTLHPPWPRHSLTARIIDTADCTGTHQVEAIAACIALIKTLTVLA